MGDRLDASYFIQKDMTHNTPDQHEGGVYSLAVENSTRVYTSILNIELF